MDLGSASVTWSCTTCLWPWWWRRGLDQLRTSLRSLQKEPASQYFNLIYLRLSRWWFQIFFIFTIFHPYLGKISNLTNIFQPRWNHQPVIIHLKWSRPMEMRDCVDVGKQQIPHSTLHALWSHIKLIDKLTWTVRICSAPCFCCLSKKSSLYYADLILFPCLVLLQPHPTCGALLLDAQQDPRPKFWSWITHVKLHVRVIRNVWLICAQFQFEGKWNHHVSRTHASLLHIDTVGCHRVKSSMAATIVIVANEKRRRRKSALLKESGTAWAVQPWFTYSYYRSIKYIYI